MKKTIPTFKTDKEAEAFVATAYLSQYDLSGGQVMRFAMKIQRMSDLEAEMRKVARGEITAPPDAALPSVDSTEALDRNQSRIVNL
jgi:hypothetical protein